MRPLIIALAIANLGQAPAVKGGTVSGAVTAVHKGRATKVAELYIYLEPTKPPSQPGRKVTAKIEQKNTRFTPGVVVIPTGGKIFFPNRDSEEHNVFSPATKKGGWIGFDLGRYNTDPVGRQRSFKQAGEFDIYCDIHKCMTAKVKVVPTLHIAKVTGGKYTFADVPPGSYRAIAWAPNSPESKSQVFEVRADGAIAVEALNLQFTSSSTHHTRIDGSAYSNYSCQ